VRNPEPIPEDRGLCPLPGARRAEEHDEGHCPEAVLEPAGGAATRESIIG